MGLYFKIAQRKAQYDIVLSLSLFWKYLLFYVYNFYAVFAVFIFPSELIFALESAECNLTALASFEGKFCFPLIIDEVV